MAFERPPDRGAVFALKEGLPSDAVIRAVAATAGAAITDLPPLYEVVDPDALDALFQGRVAGTVTFEYHGYSVTVREYAEVVVRNAATSDH